MQAVIKAGGKQFFVKPDQILEIDILNGASAELEFEPLLVIDGDNITVGTPVVEGVKVYAEVIADTKGEKIQVLKFRAKKREKRITGHRQRYSQIKIIAIGSKKPAKKTDTKKATSAKPAATPV